MNESALCCGSAGVYNLTHRKKATALLNRKLDNAAATGAQVIATANPGCLLQLRVGVRERGLSLQVRHIVDIIDAIEGPNPPR
jgi:glycolate oxidase iron-sulfur subunit